MPDSTPAAPSNPAATPVASPAPTVQAVDIAAPAPKAAESTQVSRPQPKILSVREALGLKEDPKKTREAMEAKQKAMLDPKANPPKPRAAPKPKTATPPPADNPEIDPTKVVTSEKPAPLAKIKIGDKEMTAGEVAAHVAALEAKAAKLETPPAKEEPKPSEPAKVEAGPTKSEQELDDEFIAEYAKQFEIPAEEMDAMLATGNPAALAKMIAKMGYDVRKWVAGHLNDLAQKSSGSWEIAQTVQEYQQAQNFLSAHPDISAHADGQRVRGEVDADLKANFDKVKRMIAANVADESDRDFAKSFTSDYPALLGFNVRKRLGLPIDGSGKPAVPPSSAEPPEPKQEVPRPAPPSAHRPSGGASPEAASPQRSAILRARAGSTA